MEEIEAEMEEEVEEDLPWVAKPETGTQAFKLRPYQAECVEAVLQTLRDGFSRIGVSAPTGESRLGLGLGRTRRANEAVPGSGKTVRLAELSHSREAS